MNSQELIDSIKSRALVPISQSTFSPLDLLSFATDIMRTRIVPFVIRFQEDYFVKEELTSVIPERALGAKLKSVSIVGEGREIPIPRLEPADLGKNIQGFVLRGNKIILNATPPWHQTKVSYYARPGTLVLPEAASQILAVSGNELEVTQVPPTFQPGISVDLIGLEPTFDLISTPKILEIRGKKLVLGSIFEGIKAGFWVARIGESPVPQIPLELHPLLAQAVAVQLLESLGFADKAASAQQTYDRMEADVVTLISPRIDESRKRVINRNPLVRFS